MRSFGWKTDGSVREWIFAEGYRFDFFQAIRLLERMYVGEKRNLTSQDIASFGTEFDENAKVFDEIRLRSRVDFTFPSSEIHQISPVSSAPYRAEITANILSLAGTQGPLPDVFAELLLERVKYRDTALSDFLDIFHHRLLLLMYRVRQRHRLWLEWQRPDTGSMAKYIRSFSGLSFPELHQKIQVRDNVILAYSGLLWQKPRSAVALEGILSQYFEVKAKIVPMLGSWIRIEKDDRTRIGKQKNETALGAGSYIGKKVWNRQGRFDVHLCQLSLHKFREFLPGNEKHAELVDLIKFYTNDQFEFRIRLSLCPGEAPKTRLGQSVLGWTSWMNPKTMKKSISIATA